MSVADDVRVEQTRAPSGGSTMDSQFDRTPPQDSAAEQCVIGGMLLSKDAIADVVEILRSGDFYRPAHAVIFDTILDLYGRGEPADAITVAAALADSGDLGRVGGAAYLHTLISAVPTAANAAYYARIVGERAVLRRLVEAGTRIVQLGYGAAAGAGRDVDDVVDLAQQAVYDVTERRVSEDFAVLSELLQPTLDEIEAVGSQGGLMTGVPTGFTDLDRLLNGLHPGQLIVVAGRPGLGKALALDTPLPTPDGWTTMGEVRVGDLLVGADGLPTRIVATSEVMHGRRCYQVEFGDGTTIVADAEHLWRTTTRASRCQRSETGYRSPDSVVRPRSTVTAAEAEPDVLVTSTPGYPRKSLPTAPLKRTDRPEMSHHHIATTEQIRATLRHPTDGRLNHAVENCSPLVLPERELRVPPYTLGVWLGDGHSSFVTPSSPPVAERACAGSATGLVRSVGVLGDKHIPAPYLRASEQQRRALLAGLMDTDGTVGPTGDVQFTSTSRRLALDVFELVVSLGYRCTVNTKRVNGRTEATSTGYTLSFTTVDDVFRLERKRQAHRERRRADPTTRSGSRVIVDIRPVASVPVRCVTVDNDDHLYLASRAMIPTHNSTASMDFARHAAVRLNLASAIFSLEMSKVEIVMRLLAAEARVPLHVLRSGQLSDDDWTKLARRMGEISEAPLFVDDTPNMNLMEIRAKARRLKQRHDLKLVIVDYLQLMTSPKRVESRQQEVADLSRGLKLLAKEIECPVVAVSQLNRGPEQRTDKRPQLSDLRESGCLTAATRVTRADSNAEVSLAELLATGERDVPVWALDERLKYTPRTLTHVFPSGRREVFRLRLASGKEIEATANHPFLTFEGWTPLRDLRAGSRLGTPRHIPAPRTTGSWPTEEVILLAHLIGAGSVVRRQPIRYTSRDDENLRAVTAAAEHRVMSLRLPAPHRLASGKHDPIAEWLDTLGLFGPGSDETFVPAGVFGLSTSQVALFLRHLCATNGSVTLAKSGRGGRICYASTSRRLLEDVSRLLLRFGITGRLRPVPVNPRRTRFILDVSGPDDQRRFLREIGVPGERARVCGRLLAALERAGSNTTVDTIPKDVWRRVREILVEQKSPPRLARIADVLGTADLDLHATNDVFWDEVVAIESLGEQDVFDATVPGLHNFVANGIAVHNSIEQDADVVILLHRDDYYDKESPRAGEADFIIAKHRNGPTDTVTVAAQLHLSRFVDMAVV